MSKINQKVDIWKHIEVKGPSDCWPCTLKKGDGRGHKLFDTCGRVLYAHRIVYELHYGSIPASPLIVLHLCSNPACCNPAHLKAGTKSENTKQAYKEGVLSNKGVFNGNCKLSKEAVEDIRNTSDSHHAAAIRHGISETTVSRIRRGLAHGS